MPETPPGVREEIVARIPPFCAMEKEALRAFVRDLTETEVPRGALFWGRDDAYRGVFILVEGKVKVSLINAEGREYAIRYLSAPDCFGRMEAVDGGGYSAYVEALEKCRVLVVGREKYLRVLRESPEACLQLVSMMAGRIRNLTARIESLIWERGDSRLVTTLRELAGEGGRILISQGELAKLVNMSREKLSPCLSRLRSEGFLESGRGWIRLLEGAGKDGIN